MGDIKVERKKKGHGNKEGGKAIQTESERERETKKWRVKMQAERRKCELFRSSGSVRLGATERG